MVAKLLLSCAIVLPLVLATPIHPNLEQRQFPGGPGGSGGPGFPGFHGHGPPGPIEPTITFPFTGRPYPPWGPQPSIVCSTMAWSNEGEMCSHIARRHNVAFERWVGEMPADSQSCREFLGRYNICASGSLTTSTLPAAPTTESASLSSPAISLTTPSSAAASSSVSATPTTAFSTNPISSSPISTSSSVAAGASSTPIDSSSTAVVPSSIQINSTSVSTVPASGSIVPSTTAVLSSAAPSISSSTKYVSAFPTPTDTGSASETSPATTTTSPSQCIPTQPPAETRPGSVGGRTQCLTSTAFNTTASSTSTAIASSAAPNPTIAPSDKYISYCGDGSTAAGWPAISQWMDFDYLFGYNEPNMKLSCKQWGVPDDSDEEIAAMKSSILSISGETGIDARFILSIIMQESTGCVRVITTAYSHANPGLMQSFNGTGTCNTNNAPQGIPGVSSAGTVSTPCPASMIHQQILDGTNGTVWGPGLVQDKVTADVDAADPAQAYYRTARIYNGGTFNPNDLSQPCCTSSYASDVANRLMGWVHAPRDYSCGS